MMHLQIGLFVSIVYSVASGSIPDCISGGDWAEVGERCASNCYHGHPIAAVLPLMGRDGRYFGPSSCGSERKCQMPYTKRHGDLCDANIECWSGICYKHEGDHSNAVAGRCRQRNGECDHSLGMARNPACPRASLCMPNDRCMRVILPPAGSMNDDWSAFLKKIEDMDYKEEEIDEWMWTEYPQPQRDDVECATDLADLDNFDAFNLWSGAWHPVCLGRCLSGKCRPVEIGDSCKTDGACVPYRCVDRDNSTGIGLCANYPDDVDTYMCSEHSDCRGLGSPVFPRHCIHGKCTPWYEGSIGGMSEVQTSQQCDMGEWFNGTYCVATLDCFADRDCYGTHGDHFRRVYAYCDCPTNNFGLPGTCRLKTDMMLECKSEVEDVLNFIPTDAERFVGMFMSRRTPWHHMYHKMLCCLLDPDDDTVWPEICSHTGIPTPLNDGAHLSKYFEVTPKIVVKGDVFWIEVHGLGTVSNDEAIVRENRILVDVKLSVEETCSNIKSSEWGNVDIEAEMKTGIDNQPMGKLNLLNRKALLRAPQSCGNGDCTYGICAKFLTDYELIGKVQLVDDNRWMYTEPLNATGLFQGRDTCYGWLESQTNGECGCYIAGTGAISEIEVGFPTTYPSEDVHPTLNSPTVLMGCCEQIFGGAARSPFSGGHNPDGVQWGSCLQTTS